MAKECGVEPLSAPISEMRIVPSRDREQPGDQRRTAAGHCDVPAMPQERGRKQRRGERLLPVSPISRLEAGWPTDSGSRHGAYGDSHHGERFWLILFVYFLAAE